MPTQTVTVTPPATMPDATRAQVIGYVRELLPTNVQDFLATAEVEGSRTTEVSVADGVWTVQNTFTDAAASEYKTLTAGVSQTVKDTMTGNGWAISFSPETADL